MAALCVIVVAVSLLSFQHLREKSWTLQSAQTAAQKGDPRAQYFLAKAYAKGQEVPQDLVRAASYMRQAAEQGYAMAQNDLGAMYSRGQGLEMNFIEAARWYQKAAEQGDPLAQYSMGRIYSVGRGVPTNLATAFTWYHKSAEQNLATAQYELGNMYLNGEGTPRDRGEAAKWFRRAAEQGHLGAMNNLAVVLGRNKEALLWYQKAAEQGFAKSQANLGLMYMDGSAGLRTDLVEAYKWFLLSSEKGDAIGKHHAEDFEEHNILTSDQVKEAERKADEFRAKHAKGA
jgi:TPR repeat protein